MTENVLPSEAHRRRSKRLSIDYVPDEAPSNLRSRHVLGDITSVHNTHRAQDKSGKVSKQSATGKRHRKTGDAGLIEENPAVTKSRQIQKPTIQTRQQRRQSDVNVHTGISELSIATEEDSGEDNDSNSSIEGHSNDDLHLSPVQSSITVPSLWDNETDACYEYADEIYKNLRDNEIKFLPADDYMTSMQTDINHTMRSILVDWLVEVGEEYKLSSQTLFLTINYIDRLLSKVAVNRSKLQLLGITCMLIAAKYEEIYPPSIDEFVYISDNTYTRDEVLTMESVIITSLKFHLSAATPWEFCRRFCKAIDLSNKPKLLADFLCEAFLLEPNSLKYTPSIIAASSIFLSLYTLNCTPWTPTLVAASNYEVVDLMPCARDLLTAHQKICSVETTTIKAIREKYKEAKFSGVANILPKACLSL